MTRVLTVAFAALCFLTVGPSGFASDDPEWVVGAVGTLGKVSDDGKSYEFRCRELPGKVRVDYGDKTTFKSISVVELREVKDGTSLHVLGIPQAAAQRVGPQITGIRAIVIGDFSPPDELPEELAKIKNLEWVKGSLKVDGKSFNLDDATLATGSNRRVAQFHEAKRDEVLKPKQLVYVGGGFAKKEKGEKEHRIEAKAVFLVDRKASKDEYQYYFFVGLKKLEQSKIDL